MGKNDYLCVGNAGKGPGIQMSDECLIGAENGFTYCGEYQAVRRKFALAGKASIIPTTQYMICNQCCESLGSLALLILVFLLLVTTWLPFPLTVTLVLRDLSVVILILGNLFSIVRNKNGPLDSMRLILDKSA